MTVDVSWRGFGAEMPRPFPVGTLFEGAIQYGTATHAFRAVVTWSRAGDPQLSTKDRFGARFVESSPELLALLSSPGGVQSRWKGPAPRDTSQPLP